MSRAMRRGLAGGAALALAVGLAPSARAQVGVGSGFALDRYDPAERGSDWFSGESLDMRGNWRPAAGVTADYAYRPLVLYNPNGTVNESIVRDQLMFHLGGSVNLYDRFRLGINIPVAVYQFGHDGFANGEQYHAPLSEDVGDIRLGLDVRLHADGRGQPVVAASGAAEHRALEARRERAVAAAFEVRAANPGRGPAAVHFDVARSLWRRDHRSGLQRKVSSACGNWQSARQQCSARQEELFHNKTPALAF